MAVFFADLFSFFIYELLYTAYKYLRGYSL